MEKEKTRRKKEVGKVYESKGRRRRERRKRRW